MAPRFKKNMFWCWENEDVTRAIIGFTREDIRSIFVFRDKLTAKILEDNEEIFLRKTEGNPTPADSWFKFYSKRDKNRIEELFDMANPGFFAFLFRIQRYKDWIDTQNLISKLAKVIMETSHDFPCIDIYSNIHSSDKLKQLIKKTAEEISMNFFENPELQQIKNLLTNRSFDI